MNGATFTRDDYPGLIFIYAVQFPSFFCPEFAQNSFPRRVSDGFVCGFCGIPISSGQASL
jgi:hypothetical protein